jgi:diguanylate cyclase
MATTVLVTENEVSLSTVKILLVEDYPDFARIVNHLLVSERQPKFEIENAQSLSEALQKLNRQFFDLILLDLGLPDSQGMDTFDQIAALHKKIPIVILSGMDDENLSLALVKKGAQDYIVKNDIDERFFARILKHALERYDQQKQVEELNEKLERLSFLDPLTELLNRRGLQRVLLRELEFFNREGSNLMVILLDLDNFKPINDAFGHAVGDIVLKEIAQILRNTVRTTDYVSRIGGDEFLILLPNTRSVEAVHLSERMRLAINRSPVVMASGEIVRASASFGVVSVNKRRPSIDELLEETHSALAKSKKQGKNRVSFGNKEELNEIGLMDLLKKSESYHALRQPIVDLSDEKIVAYEFLSRTNVNGLEMPDEFFSFAREKNMLSVVDRKCLEASVAASYRVPPACDKHVNLLPSTIISFQNEHFKRLFPPENLAGTYYIEISEQQILGDPSYLVPMVNEFRKRKIRIAIDDVGFGRSCLESLIVLHPDVIKIDKKLVKDVSSDPARRELLHRLLNAVENLSTKIIVEGIETREDLLAVKDLGVRYGQGYYWGKPL